MYREVDFEMINLVLVICQDVVVKKWPFDPKNCSKRAFKCSERFKKRSVNLKIYREVDFEMIHTNLAA